VEVPILIDWYRDEDTEMDALYVGGKCLSYGNYGDVHVESILDATKVLLGVLKIKFKIKKHKWDYNENARPED
jgi:hypothetical protein